MKERYCKNEIYIYYPINQLTNATGYLLPWLSRMWPICTKSDLNVQNLLGEYSVILYMGESTCTGHY